MSAKSSPALPIFLITLLLTIALLIALFIAAPIIEPTLAGPAPEAGAPLPPSGTPYAIGFDDATEVNDNWQSKSGNWSLDDSQSPGQYIQESVDALSAISIYRRGIKDEYSVEVELQHLDGESGGLFFNAPDPSEATVADVLRYNRTEGEVEWGQVNADGSFLSVGGTSDGSYAFRTMSVTVTESLTPTPTATPTVTPQTADLDPSGQAYLLGFNGAQSIDNWQPGAGNWGYDQGYVQSALDGVNQFTYYKGRAKGDYEYEVTLSYLSGEMGGGALFNAPNNNSLVGAMLVAFNPDSASGNGAIMQWGYFDNAGAFQFLGDHLVIPSAIDGVERRLRIQVEAGNYSIWLDDGLFLLDQPFAPEIQKTNPYVGLYTSMSSVRFGSAQVKVSTFAAPTHTPTPTPTISATPTVQPTPTTRPTPHPDALLPRDEIYDIGFKEMSVEEKADWRDNRGTDWPFVDEGLKQTNIVFTHAMKFYLNPIAGDYEYEVSLKYVTPGENEVDKGLADAGLIFNAPRVGASEAYYVIFTASEDDADGEQIVEWGYFEQDGSTVTRVAIGQLTGQESIRNEKLRKFKVKVTEDEYSIWLDDILIDNANRLTFPDDGRVIEPSLGVYTNETRALFVDASIKVSEYLGVDPTPTFTPTMTGVATATPRTTSTSTPTPTWTPGTPTATPTPVAPSALPTPTNTPIIINQPPPPTPLPDIVISTPTTKPATQTAIAAAVVAATATDMAGTTTAVFGQSVTATQVALSATQTAAIVPTSPLLSPTATAMINAGAVDTGQASATAAAQTMTAIANVTVTSVAGSSLATGTPTALVVTESANPALSETETAVAQTVAPQSTLTATVIAGAPVLVVTATSTPTQRPIEEGPPTPAGPAAPAQLAFFARIINAVVASTALIWLAIGLAVFIGVLGVIAGVTFRSNEEERYALHESADGVGGEELDEDEIDRILDELAQGSNAPLSADNIGLGGEEGNAKDGAEGDSRDRNQGDNWPTSLP